MFIMERTRCSLIIITGLVIILFFVGYQYCIGNIPLRQTATKEGHWTSTIFSGTDTNKKLTAIRFLNIWDQLRYNLVSDLKSLLDEGIKEDDPRLLSLIRRNLFPPSYHMVSKLSFNMPEPTQATIAKKYFNTGVRGFYIESGGFDGERSSNTYALEILGWQGLLVEPDPYYFFQSLGKNRKAWKLNAALCTSEHSAILQFKESRSGKGKLTDSGELSVPCFPLPTIMAALNRTRIDFFSLDVEGLELEILKSLPYKKMDICAICAEYLHIPGGAPALEMFMRTVGYSLHKKIDYTNEVIRNWSHDLFLVKKNCQPKS